MVGAIRKRDILAHPFVTIHCFGWQVFFRALMAGRNQTFLTLLTRTSSLEPSKVRIPQLVGRCIRLELRLRVIFDTLAHQFADRRSVKGFFETLAHQEQGHAELLELCREAASRAVWIEESFAPWRDAVPHLQRQMDEIKSSLESLESVSDALRLVIQIESSEVNRVFNGIVASSGSDFVRKSRVFQRAGVRHISYICAEIPKLAPELGGQCRELWAAYFADTSK